MFVLNSDIVNNNNKRLQFIVVYKKRYIVCKFISCGSFSFVKNYIACNFIIIFMQQHH